MSASSTGQRAILLVDDNPDIFTMYREVLPLMSDFLILTAEHGVAALEQIELRKNANMSPVSCIVIDVMMPELDGLQLVRALRGDPDTAEIPLVILTALAQDHQRFAGLASGADQYLTKPISVPDLIAAISTAITLSPLERLRRWRDFAEGPDTEA